MKFCLNPRCEGPCVYEGVSSANGRRIEFYRCLRCMTLHKVAAQPAEPLLADDEDTPISASGQAQELPIVNISDGAQS